MSTDEPADGVALCLSGGGYRAMLFHVGVVWRLHDAGWLHARSTASRACPAARSPPARSRSPGRGSTADGLEPTFVAPVRALAGRTVDATSVIAGRAHRPTRSPSASPRPTASTCSATRRCRTCPTTRASSSTRPACSRARCSASPSPTWPTGASAASNDPDVALADAVAASSAFPPVLSPFELDLARRDLDRRARQRPRPRRVPRARGPLRRRRLRQPRARDRVEGVPHRPRLRRRRPDAARARPRPRLGPPPVPRPRRDRQPGPLAAQAPVRRRVPRRRARSARTGASAATIADFDLADALPAPYERDARAGDALDPARAARRRRAGAAHQLGLRGLRRGDARPRRPGAAAAGRLPLSRGGDRQP